MKRIAYRWVCTEGWWGVIVFKYRLMLTARLLNSRTPRNVISLKSISMNKADLPQGCLTKILELFGVSMTPRQAVKEPLPYRLRDNFLSPAEFSFFKVLKQVVPNEMIICPKVNLYDLFFVVKPNENISFRNKIDRKHVDFLLCDPISVTPLLGIELDDSSHSRKDRQMRDQFVNEVFEAAGIPLLHVTAARGYSVPEINDMIQDCLNETISRTVEKNVSNHTPICPKCDTSMVLRTATKGKRIGQQFWGCSNYPDCREIKINEP